MSIELVMPSNHLLLCRPLLLPPSIFPSIRVFSNESVLHIRWQIKGVSASASVLPMNIHDWFPLGWTGWISLLSKGLSRVFSNIQFKSIHSSAFSFLYSPTLTSIHDYYILHPYYIYMHTTSIHDKMWSTGKMANHFSSLAFRTPWTVWKG